MLQTGSVCKVRKAGQESLRVSNVPPGCPVKAVCATDGLAVPPSPQLPLAWITPVAGGALAERPSGKGLKPQPHM